ncbi:MAG TPA: polysaccharide pyruvyl transferase family protein [Candidatus Saccharibacteria bacterium]|nr:polysaccharide pyruvyl transferase family protein [Candidatus Saccharibacteria bacterium]
MKYVIGGSAAFYGNKGAAAMLEASVQSITAKDQKAEFTLFSLYPEKDRKQNTYKNLSVLSTKPVYLALVVNPLALLHKILIPLRPVIRKNNHIKALYDCDVYLDEPGISFVDGREKFLIFNVASILPPILMNKKIVKCAQAMGPFNNPINRFFSKLLLPRITHIMARGSQTKKYLQVLNLTNVTPASDYAFLLKISEQEKKVAQKILTKAKLSPSLNKNYLVICPSRVVEKKCDKLGVDYAGVIADFLNAKNLENQKFIIMAHAAREGSEKPHNNDLPLCKKIFELVDDKNKTVFFNQEISAQAQRYIISTVSACLVSRFHAMIASLSVGVPVGVIGWSHKYKEILSQFGLEKYAIDLKNLNEKSLGKIYEMTKKDNEKIKSSIKNNIESVKNESLKNTNAIV